jgi:Ca2+-transporting ATPase
MPARALLEAGLPVNLANLQQVLKNNDILLIQSQTYTFTTLGISQLFNAIGMRNLNRSIFRFNHLENKMMIIAFLLGFLLQISVTEIDVLIQVFGTKELTLREWTELTVLSTAPLWFHELFVFARYLKNKNKQSLS